MSRRDWTDKHIKLLCRGCADSMSFAEIAALINDRTGSGFSRNACIGKAMRLGLVSGRTRGAHDVEHRIASRKAAKRPKRKETRLRLPSGDLPPDLDSLKDIEMAPKPAEFLGIAFVDLEPQHCRYPRGGNNGEPILFCGQPKLDDSSYCASCHARCHAAPRAMNISEAERLRRQTQGYLSALRRRNAA